MKIWFHNLFYLHIRLSPQIRRWWQIAKLKSIGYPRLVSNLERPISEESEPRALTRRGLMKPKVVLWNSISHLRRDFFGYLFSRRSIVRNVKIKTHVGDFLKTHPALSQSKHLELQGKHWGNLRISFLINFWYYYIFLTFFYLKFRFL